MKILFTIFLSAVASVCIYATDIKDDKYTTIDDYNGNALTDSNGNPLIRINLLDGAGNDLTLTIDNNYPNKGTVKEIGSGSNPLVSSKEYAERYTSVLINAIEVTAINANAFKGFTNVTSFEIKTTTPPTIAENTFPAEWKESCNLIVPDEAVDGYKNSDWANYFYSIIGYDDNEIYTSVVLTINATEIKEETFKDFDLTKVTSFEIETTTPPTIAENTFPTEWKESCNLIVPDEAVDGYKNSDWAKYFYSIIGYDGNEYTSVVLTNATNINEDAFKDFDLTNVTRVVLINATEINKNTFKDFDLTKVTSFEIETTTPPTIAENAFPAEWKESCNLIVPGAAIDGYKNSDWANYFYSINGEVINREEGTSEIGTGTPNNIANIKNTSITISGKNIILGAITEVKVYSITGEQIYNGVTNKVNVLNNGIYIVKTANTTQRVIVK